ncbi:MAG: sugar ABC transporter ATP-binding protein [Chloroflexi bacterium]|nr:sugar ABC transporter ATP-binding protein [Chloroflexota bacterium]
MEPILAVKHINKFFGTNQVLKDVSFSVEPGQVHALVGENGAGKSTLMNIIGGIHKPDSGDILLDGNKITIADPWQARELGISVVFQELSLTPNMTVAENIFVRREAASRFGFINWKKLNQQAQDLFDQIGINLSATALVSSYAVGMQQIIEIAKAISFDARVIIMDEPTSALSETEVDRLYSLVGDLTQRGVAIVFISHKLNEVVRIADKISVLRDGQMVGEVDPKASDQGEIIRLMVGRNIDDLYPEKGIDSSDVILEVRNLSNPPVFDDVSITLRRGEILGFAGLVGAGRTEVARAIFGADRFVSGEILLDGVPVEIRSPRHAIEAGIMYLTEDRKMMGLFLPMTVRDNIVAASLDQYRNAVGLLQHKAIVERSQAFMDLVDIRPRDDRTTVVNLSGGNQQKSLLAKCLSAHPKVLIADEPTRGVDVGAKAKIHQDLRKLADQGVGVIVISSELPEVLGLSDRVAVFREGHLASVLAGDDISQEAVMRHAIR